MRINLEMSKGETDKLVELMDKVYDENVNAVELNNVISYVNYLIEKFGLLTVVDSVFYMFRLEKVKDYILSYNLSALLSHADNDRVMVASFNYLIKDFISRYTTTGDKYLKDQMVKSLIDNIYLINRRYKFSAYEIKPITDLLKIVGNNKQLIKALNKVIDLFDFITPDFDTFKNIAIEYIHDTLSEVQYNTVNVLSMFNTLIDKALSLDSNNSTPRYQVVGSLSKEQDELKLDSNELINFLLTELRYHIRKIVSAAADELELLEIIIVTRNNSKFKGKYVYPAIFRMLMETIYEIVDTENTRDIEDFVRQNRDYKSHHSIETIDDSVNIMRIELYRHQGGSNLDAYLNNMLLELNDVTEILIDYLDDEVIRTSEIINKHITNNCKNIFNLLNMVKEYKPDFKLLEPTHAKILMFIEKCESTIRRNELPIKNYIIQSMTLLLSVTALYKKTFLESIYAKQNFIVGYGNDLLTVKVQLPGQEMKVVSLYDNHFKNNKIYEDFFKQFMNITSGEIYKNYRRRKSDDLFSVLSDISSKMGVEYIDIAKSVHDELTRIIFEEENIINNNFLISKLAKIFYDVDINNFDSILELLKKRPKLVSLLDSTEYASINPFEYLNVKAIPVEKVDINFNNNIESNKLSLEIDLDFSHLDALYESENTIDIDSLNVFQILRWLIHKDGNILKTPLAGKAGIFNIIKTEIMDYKQHCAGYDYF